MSKVAPLSPKPAGLSQNDDQKDEAVHEDEYNGETREIEKTGTGPRLGTTEKHWVPVRVLKQRNQVPHGWGIMRFGPRDATEDAVSGKPLNWTGAEGNWKKGRLEGHGTYWFDNGDRYAGIFRDGKPGSIGTWWFANHDSYQGQCAVLRPKDDQGFSIDDVTDLSREGQGIYWYSKGGRYEGQFRRNERWGNGTMSYSDGGHYEGEWEKGEKSGRGTMTYHDDERYEGQWQADKMHGRGVCFFIDGKVEFGNYDLGNRVGQAVRWSSDRTRAWRFMDGKLVDELDAEQLAANNLSPPPPHGVVDNVNVTGLHCPHRHGVLTYADGARYVGGIDNGVPEDESGQARLVFASEVCYEGQFVEGRQHGNGTEIHPNGSRYEGQFRFGRKDGEGTFWYHGGDQYHGNFKAGHRDGLGTYWFPDGAVLISSYRKGEPDGPGAWWSKRMPDGNRDVAARLQDGALVQKTSLVAAAELAERLQFPEDPDTFFAQSQPTAVRALQNEHFPDAGDEMATREQRRNSLYPPGDAAPLPVAPAVNSSTAESSIPPGQEQTILLDHASLHSSLATIDPRSEDGQKDLHVATE